MKKGYFKVKDLKEFLKDLDDDLDIFVNNSFNPLGNISELAEARRDTYGFFGNSLPCVILDTSQNVEFDEED